MNRILFALVTGFFLSVSASAQVVFQDTFNRANGALIGSTPDVSTGNWTLNNSTVNPIQILNNAVPLANNGQDVYAAFSTAVPTTAGTRLFAGVDINVSAAQSTGDYFMHYSDPVGTNNFYGRLFIKSTTGGFNVGILSTSGGGAATYGTTVLNFGQTYRVVTSWDFVAGALNDTFSVYIDPTNPTQNLNTAEVAGVPWTGLAEPASGNVTSVNLRQGAAASAPTLVVDNLTVSTVFSTVINPVPEPVTMLGFAALGFGAVAYRRRRSA